MWAIESREHADYIEKSSLSPERMSMAWLTSVLVEPFYRLVYGPPLDSPGARPRPAFEAEAGGHGGVIIVAGGVGGFDLCGTGLRYVLAARRLYYDLTLFRWGHGFGRMLADLTDVGHCEAQSALLARLIKRLRAERPEAPVFLVAKSGGCGVAVRALELLDDSVVERAILLAPALSPGYDLSGALRAVRAELVVFWSPLDIFVLGLGTALFGTIDRVWGTSAGLVGFRLPDQGRAHGDPRRAYAKLRQVRWRPLMVAHANFGGHIGPDSPFFLNRYVVPLLRVDGTAES
jgi:hypothetical protein